MKRSHASFLVVLLPPLLWACDDSSPKRLVRDLPAEAGACNSPDCSSSDGGPPLEDGGPCASRDTSPRCQPAQDGSIPPPLPLPDAGTRGDGGIPPIEEEVCAAPCVLPHATAECRIGLCVLTGCEDGFSDLDEAPGNGCECQSPFAGPHGSTCCHDESGAEVCSAERGGPFVQIPATTTWLGCAPESGDLCEADEIEPRQARLSAYTIDIHEVTQAEYAQYLTSAGVAAPPVGFAPATRPLSPVSYLTWDEARSYCRWLGGDLPTDAQWEHAARGTRSSAQDGPSYPWGNELPSCETVNVGECLRGVADVASFARDKSAWGIYDLAGNVAEWTRGAYDSLALWPAQTPPALDPSGREGDEVRTIRGGSSRDWINHARVSNRSTFLGEPHARSLRVGFRCVRDSQSEVSPERPPGRLSARSTGGCLIRHDKSLGCWGMREGLTDTPPDDSFARVDSASQAPACGVRSDGTLACWSANVATELPPDHNDYVDVAGDSRSVCGLRTGGEILCQGELGLATKDAVQLSSAAQYELCALSQTGLVECGGTQGPRGKFEQISLGPSSGCALDASGAPTCWTAEALPSPSPKEGPFTQVSAGAPGEACALDAQGHVTCWGGLEDPPPDLVAVDLSAFRGGACAVDANDRVTCWGSTLPPPNHLSFASMALGATAQDWCVTYQGGATLCSELPGAPADFASFRALSLGHEGGCGIRQDRSLHCWGGARFPQADPTFVPPGQDFAALACGGTSCCALRGDGAPVCWGPDVAAPPEATFTKISGQFTAFCGLSEEGSITCWGASNTAILSSPPATAGFIDLSVGTHHACALHDDGHVACWGTNDRGQTNVPELTDVVQLGVGFRYSCALHKNGTLTCWGRARPEAIPVTDAISSFSAAPNHLCVTRAERVLCWDPEQGPRIELIRE